MADSGCSAFTAPHVRGEQSQIHAQGDSDEVSINSSTAEVGVKGIEAVSQTWTRRSLIAAYLGDLGNLMSISVGWSDTSGGIALLTYVLYSIFLLAISTSLESQMTTNLTVYATSAFAQHSLVATVLVVQGVVNAVIKPPMAKFANVFGRLEAFAIAILFYDLGLIQMAASSDVRAFASAQIFYSAGQTGLQILQQVFIADTSDLLNRALFSSLPDIPVLVTVWLGPLLASSVLAHSNWRWGYGIWTIVLPVAFLPLSSSLYLNLRRAGKLGLLPKKRWQGKSPLFRLRSVWHELDITGLLLLSAAISLILIPLTLAATATQKWHNPSVIAMLVVGCLSLLLFPLWESMPKFAPHPFLSLRLLRNRSVLAGCALGLFYFAVFYTSIQPYFSSYLQIVHSLSVTAAGHVTQIFSFSASLSSVVISLMIKYTRHYKYFITAGGCFYLVGVGLMIRYRVQEASVASIVGSQIAVGIGGGMVNVPAQLGVQASVSHRDVAAVTAMFLTSVEIGGAIGAAISGAVWTGTLLPKLRTYLPTDQQDQAALIYGNLTIAKGLAIGTPERAAVNRSYQETMHVLLIVAACLAIPILPLSLAMKNHRLDHLDQKVKGTVIGQSQAGQSAQVLAEPEGDDVDRIDS